MTDQNQPKLSLGPPPDDLRKKLGPVPRAWLWLLLLLQIAVLACLLVVLMRPDLNKFMPYYLDEPFMALSYHLHIVAEKITDMPEPMKYGTAAVLLGLILIVNSASITLRVWLRSRKKW